MDGANNKLIPLSVALLLLGTSAVAFAADWPQGPAETFVPSANGILAGATLELRSQATAIGAEVKLRQICRWSDADAPAFLPIADLVVARFNSLSQRTIELTELQALLRDAGVNLASIRFTGAFACRLTRSDTPPAPATPIPFAAVPDPTPPQTESTAASDPRSLRQMLIADLCSRLSLTPESLQIQFNPQDEKTLALAEPLVRFSITPRRVRNLGEVAWDVLIVSSGATQKLSVIANARAWQNQLVAARPVSHRQIIGEQDVTERRALVDHLDNDPLLTRVQTVGELAATDLKPGMILTARMVEAVPLAKPGQLITLTVTQGGVQIQTVARAMECGTLGQTIRVRNDATRETLDVVLTGPQTAQLGTQPTSPKTASLQP